MFPYWMLLLLMSGFVPGICEASSRHFAKKKDIPRGFFFKHMGSNTKKGHFDFLKRNEVSMSNSSGDPPLKQGSFKIDDGKVIGGGIYDIGKDGVSIDLKIKIAPDYTEEKPSGVSKATAAPTGSVTTPAPGGGSETTAAPGGGSETTAAPGGGSETAAAPGGGSETTAAPGGGSETTAAPGGGSETTAAPGGGSETTAAPTTPSSTTGSDDEQEALSLHNKFRAVHDAPAMKLNAEMSKSAASYAQTIANRGSLDHSSKEERDGNGENLAYDCNKGQSVKSAINGWYNEICSPGYSFGSENAGGALHLTQMVWKESVELGFGKGETEKNGQKCTYYVARYKKAGNMKGDYAKNVVKGSFDKQSYCSKIKKS